MCLYLVRRFFGGDIAENVHQFKAIMAEYTK